MHGELFSQNLVQDPPILVPPAPTKKKPKPKEIPVPDVKVVGPNHTKLKI
jgi:hypothetical protein